MLKDTCFFRHFSAFTVTLKVTWRNKISRTSLSRMFIDILFDNKVCVYIFYDVYHPMQYVVYINIKVTWDINSFES